MSNRALAKKQALPMAFLDKKQNEIFFESDSVTEAADFPKFIVLESLQDICQAKLSPFLLEKIILTKATSRSVKQTRNGNLFMEVDSWRHPESILKIMTFQITKCKPYPHKKMKTLKGVIRISKLSLATTEEITNIKN